MSLTVYGRLIALEVRDGSDYRAVAAEPIIRRQHPPAMRGRILAHDGTVLAYDEALMSLAVQYRWLQEPADPRWLRQLARSRLPAAQRRSAQRIAAEQQNILTERHQLAQHLAALCGLTDAQWQARCRQIQQRVETIAAGVNARQSDQADSRRTDDDFADDLSLPSLVGRSIVDALFDMGGPAPAPHIIVAEELQEHVVCTGLPLESVVEIETHPTAYPGVKLQPTYRRVYPEGPLAAHVLGYLGAVRPDEIPASQKKSADGNSTTAADAYQPDDLIGRSGIERQYESLLRSRRGLIVDRLDARGQSLQSTTVRQPTPGRDIVLTIDPALQRAAQTLLDQALARRLPSGNPSLDQSCGGAVLVIDVHTGAVLAAASGPRFDPNAFIGGNSAEVQSLLSDSARPLLDRTDQMALPPGSVFKIISACAILAGGIDPAAPVDCQGYLHQPEASALRHLPQIRRRPRRRHAGRSNGPQLQRLLLPLRRTTRIRPAHGLGAATGSGRNQRHRSPRRSRRRTARGEHHKSTPHRSASAGNRPRRHHRHPAANRPHARRHRQRWPTRHAPHRRALRDYRPTNNFDDPIQSPSPRSVPDLTDRTLAAIRKGLRQVVADEQGTAHATVELSDVAIAGKTGTAETGGGRPDHAWFAGYAPADQPRVAFVVVLQHAGEAATTAGPVAKLLVQRMDQIGYFSRSRRAAASIAFSKLRHD